MLPAPVNRLTAVDGLPFEISPSISCLRLHANEVGKSSVEFTGWFPKENRHTTIRFEFHRCICARLLAFGGEATLGMGSMSESRWLSEARLYQRVHFPDHADNFKEVRHFFLRGKDCSVEILAEGFTWKEVAA